MLEELAESVSAVAGQVGPAVVSIGRGAGTVIAPGHLLTNAHNLPDAGATMVRFADGRVAEGTVTAVDVDGDLAVVAVDVGDVAALAWADDPPTMGTPVLAVATTRSGSPRVTFGLVSTTAQAFRGPRGRRIHGAVEHTAPLGRGSSGGPIVGLDGRLLGINTHRRGDGFYLAQPATAALRERVDDLTRGHAPRTFRLGLAVAPPHVARNLRAAVGLEQRDGLLVRDVDPDGLAGRAGVRVGDLVIAADGAPVTSPDDLLERLADLADGITLTLVRGVDEIDIRVSFGGDDREEG